MASALCPSRINRAISFMAGSACVKKALYPEKIKPHQGRLTTLPGDCHIGTQVVFQELPDVCFAHILTHAEGAARIEISLLEEEAVVATQVAGRTRGLGHDVEGSGRRSGSHYSPRYREAIFSGCPSGEHGTAAPAQLETSISETVGNDKYECSAVKADW